MARRDNPLDMSGPIGERIINIRGIEGINRMENQRLDDPLALYTARNLYARAPGVLAKRPGSVCVVADRTSILGRGDSDVLTEFDNPDEFQDFSATGETTTPAVTDVSLEDYQRDLDPSMLGVFGAKPAHIKGQILVNKLPMDINQVVQERPQRVAGLSRIYFDQGIKRYWIGAFNLPTGDRLFYIDSNQRARLIHAYANIVTSKGADFFFLPARYLNTTNGDDPDRGYYAICTNRLNQPITLKHKGQYDVEAAALDVCPSAGYVGIGGPGVPANTWERLTHVQSFCMYNGSVVYGGFRTFKPSNGAVINYENYICFSDVGKPHEIAGDATTGLIYSIRVGDTEAEAVTAVATSQTQSDAAGIRGQLVIFTERRVTVFDGMPPQTGTPLGTDFTSVISSNVGCNAPRTVVNCPLGVIFLGSDGCVYLLPNFTKAPPIRIGTKVWDILRALSPRQQRQCSAYWHPRGYYCISYPGPGGKADVPTAGSMFQAQQPGQKQHVPNRQLWADFRQPNPGLQDMNAKWFGPHEGLLHSCTALALGSEDNGEIYAGSSVNGNIFELWREDLTWDADPHDVHIQWVDAAVAVGQVARPTSFALSHQRWLLVSGATAAPEPSWPTNPALGQRIIDTGDDGVWEYVGRSSIKQIDSFMATGVMDAFDSHKDKEITAISVGVQSDRPTTVATRLVALGAFAGPADDSGQSWSDSVTPAQGGANLIGSTLIVGFNLTTPPDRMNSVTNRPSHRMIGRAWRAEISETATAGARIAYSDLQFRVRRLGRRP